MSCKLSALLLVMFALVFSGSAYAADWTLANVQAAVDQNGLINVCEPACPAGRACLSGECIDLCNPACSENQACVANKCVDVITMAKEASVCTGNADCKNKLNSAWVCKWGMCVKDNAYLKKDTFDSDYQLKVSTNDDHETADKQGYTDPDTITIPVPELAVEDYTCLYSADITYLHTDDLSYICPAGLSEEMVQERVEHTACGDSLSVGKGAMYGGLAGGVAGAVGVGALVGLKLGALGGPIGMGAGIVVGGVIGALFGGCDEEDHYTIDNYCDNKRLIINPDDHGKDWLEIKSTNRGRDVGGVFRTLGSTGIFMYVDDFHGGTMEGWYTRYVRTKMDIATLQPNPLQKCAIAEGDTKPRLTFKCAMTPESCFDEKAGSCMDCTKKNIWVVVKATGSCDGSYAFFMGEEAYYNYTCKKEMIDKDYGIYKTCGYTVTATDQIPQGSRRLCPYGCDTGRCKPDRAPTLSSIMVNPKIIGLNDTMRITATATDPDTISDGNSSRKEKLKLECATKNNGTIDLCTSNLTDQKPSCTVTKIPDPWKTGGNMTVHCRVKDEADVYSEEKTANVTVDITPPVSEIVSPEENSAQASSFVIKVTDSDNVILNKCFFFTSSGNGTVKDRACNKAFALRIGPGGDCAEHGDCEVSVYATDGINNTGKPSGRTFSIKLVYTNITSPGENSWQTGNFGVQTEDSSIIADETNITCTYSVYSMSAPQLMTLNRTARPCNGNFTVTTGEEKDCREFGDNRCKVVVRAQAIYNGKEISDTEERFFSIDWLTPESKIISFPPGWQTGDFSLLVTDDPKGSELTDCQYRVVSGGIEAVKWTSRPCGTGVQPAELIIRECKHEGGEACRIFVRPLGRNSVPGLGDNISIPILLNTNVTDYDGFSVATARATYRGINFTGMTRTELRASTFYVCNATSKVADCIKSYETGQGLGRPVYCGGLMQGLSGRCELRCNDMEIRYYLAAKGQPLHGTIRTDIVISPVATAICPSFNMKDLNEFLRIFTELKETVSIQAMEIDTYMRKNGDSDIANNETLSVLREALLLIDDHLSYMSGAMEDLNVYVSAEIILRSQNKLDEVSALLRRIRQSTRLEMELGFRGMVRYNSTATIPATVTKNGPGNAYGKIYCTIMKPSGVEKIASECMQFSATYNIIFSADRIGRWSYSCNIGRSVRSDCSFEVNATPVTGTFDVMPGLDAYMETLYTLSAVQRGRLAPVGSMVYNPDEVEKYVALRCDFTDPKGFSRRNTSACADIYPGERTALTTYMTADVLGNWTVSKCGVYSSQNAGCDNPKLDNSSDGTLSFEVAMPTDIFIDTLNIPGTLNNGTSAQVTASVRNPTAMPAYVTLECVLSNPSGTQTFSDRRPMDMQTSSTFAFNATFNVPGRWNIDSCVTKKTTNSDYSGSVTTYTMSNAGYIDVTSGTKLYFTSSALPNGAMAGTQAMANFLVRNPSLARYAQVTCQYRSPTNTPLAATSDCVAIGASSEAMVQVGFAIDKPGTWIVESCSLYGSVNSDCSQSSVHATLSPVGDFNSPGAIVTESVHLSELFIGNINTAAAAYNNSRTSAVVTVRNSNPANTTYAHAGCVFTNPMNGNTMHVSSCKEVPPNSRTVFSLLQHLYMPGAWTVRNCFVNASIYSNCAYSMRYDTSNQTRIITVSVPQDLYVSGVAAPAADVTNSTEIKIGVTVENPLNDDRFGSVKCTITDPNGGTQTKSGDCAAFPAKGFKQFSLPLVVNVVGTWVVSSCSVTTSNNAGCTGSSTGELINGDTFDVVRGYNLQFSSLAPDNPSYIGAPTNIAYTVNNPSSTDRYGRVKCTVSRGAMTYTNMSGCFLAQRESFISSNLVAIANSTGTWSLVCVIERSFDPGCSSPTIAEVINKTFEVMTPPDLFIQSVDVPIGASKSKPLDVIVKVRNLGLQRFYGFVGCTFKNAVNETITNTSRCENMTKDTTSAIVSYTPSLRGKLDIYDCYVNGATTSDCSGSERHNISAITKSMTITSSIFTINSVATQDRLLMGEVIDIAVTMTNNDERDQRGFVNCTLLSPRGVTYRIRSENQTFNLGETSGFHLQQKADVAGRWILQSCSAYRINNLSYLEDANTMNREINVTTAPPIELCSESLPCRAGYVCMSGRCMQQSGECSVINCPGIKDGCYCLQGSCIKCGEGYTCSNARCVVETSVVQSCTAAAECPTEMSCVGGICTQNSECFVDADCGSGMACKDSTCTVPADTSGATNLVVIVLAAISAPIIIFIYMKRVV